MDVQVCTVCGVELAKVAYRHLPLRPLVPRRCANCGASRREKLLVAAIAPGERPDLSPVCTHCKTSQRRDARIHRALTRKLGCETMAQAAHIASEQGRHTLALKLATAAFHFEDDALLARSVRLQELDAVGEGGIAEQEGLNWLKAEDTPALVGGLVGDILLRHGKAEAALQAMTVGLERDPEDRYLRLERAEVLEELEHFDDAVRESVTCMTAEDPITQRALELLERVADRYFVDQSWEDIREIFRAASPWSHSSPELCYIQGCAEMATDGLSEARRWLLRALQLDSERDEAATALEHLERKMGLAKTPVARR